LFHPRLALFLLFTISLLAQTVHKAESRKLLVVSIAGLDERFLAYPASRVKIPNIRKLLRDGAVADGVIGVAPSDAAPSATALVTGVPPFQKAAALWQAASKSGMKTATVCWTAVGTPGIAFNFPENPDALKARNVEFESVASKTTPAGLIDSIEKAAPDFEKDLWDDTSSARAAVWLLKNGKADVVFVQLTDVDSEQRETGALSIYAREVLDTDDDLIGQMLAAAPPGVIVALVSGHGLENQNYIVRPRVLLKLGKSAAPETRVEVEDGLIGTRDAAVAERLRQFMKDPRRSGIAREVPIAEVSAKAPALVRQRHWIAAFDTPTNYIPSAEDRGPALGPGTHKGVSGLWPTRPAYRSVFIVAGAGIHPKKLGQIDILQIAPTLADAIGIKLPEAHAGSLWPAVYR
jgi:Type I phosphodiesterase / nucleotide pyrophosphatase